MKSQSLPPASPVSQQALLETSEGQTTPAGSGRRLLQSYTPLIQHGCSLKMCLASLLLSKRWHSSICALRWKVSATRFNRLLFRLVPSMPDTEETEFGLWPTPTSDEANNVKMWPTPRASEAMETSLPPSRVNNHDKCTLSQSMHHPHFVSGETKANGSLNPAWVEWLMGYPIAHTACADWETPSSRKSPKK